MCCFFLSLVLLGPRIVGAFWWLFQPLVWEVTFRGWAFIWWLWPILGLIFVPWATLMYVLVGFDGVSGFDWLWIGLALFADFASYGGGVGRKRIPNYQGY